MANLEFNGPLDTIDASSISDQLESDHLSHRNKDVSDAPPEPHVDEIADVPTAGQADSKLKPLVGGDPINLETAMELRLLVYGSTMHSFSSAWRAVTLNFQNIRGPFPYGLHMHRNGTKGILVCIQAHLLKHLIFKYDTAEEILNNRVLSPTHWERQDALVKGLGEILWRAADGRDAKVCLTQAAAGFAPDVRYRPDGITELLRVFSFSSKEALINFLKRNLPYFEPEGTCGVILFLYSLALTRGFNRLRDDWSDPVVQLLTDNEDCTQALINLMLTGKAVRHLHNGVMVYDMEGQPLSKPSKGVSERCDVGFLYWHREEPDKERTQVGSMLKTPRRPIWVTHVNGQFGVLFSTRPDLVSDWRIEHTFSLHYYSGLATQTKAARLTVDTRFDRRVRNKPSRNPRWREDEQKRIPALEQCIFTKWPGAEVNWNGLGPFV